MVNIEQTILYHGDSNVYRRNSFLYNLKEKVIRPGEEARQLLKDHKKRSH